MEINKQINYYNIPHRSKEMGVYWQGKMYKSDYMRIIEYVDTCIKPLMESATEEEEAEHIAEERKTANDLITEIEGAVANDPYAENVMIKCVKLKEILQAQGFLYTVKP